MERPLHWIAFPDDRFKVEGLPWFDNNAPKLWRLPAAAMDDLPQAVAHQAHFPTGGRIRFKTSTTQLHIRMQAVGQNRRAAHPNWHGVDLFVDGEYWRSLMATDRVQDFEFFSDRDHRVREITLYLPLYDEIEIAAIGCDDSAIFELVSSYNHPLPLVFYGSSIVQGSGAGRPSQTYAALVARKTNLDFINLGFGGAGRGEPVVVDLVNQLRACCFVLDLGKSYDFQPPDVYINMLASIRNAHPATPIISVTSITSSRELYYDDEFKAVSEHTRRVIGEATRYCQEHGDDNLYLVNGSDLIATTQMDAFYEGVHPNILGTTLIAERLVTLVQRCVRQTGAAND